MINHALTSRGKNRTIRFELKPSVNRIVEGEKNIIGFSMGPKMSKDSLDNSVRIRGKSKENKIVYYII